MYTYAQTHSLVTKVIIMVFRKKKKFFKKALYATDCVKINCEL